MATLLDRFRSLSRPSLTSRSGGFSSMAKKNASAEDLLIDNMYNNGNLSIDAYIRHLEGRLDRPWNTPRTNVSLSAKIERANEGLVDAEVARAHDAGEISTRARYEYELEKLGVMQEPGSTAHINQTKLVQSLKDRSEKEDRSAFRIQKLNELSRSPEDTSERLWEKANLYGTLAEQARLDGDEQQAITLGTQQNNYVASARRAEINDFITETRLAVSETPTAGLGVPSADEGSKVYSQLTGNAAPTTGAGGTSLIGSGGGVSSGTSSGMKTLDRQQKSLERMYQQRVDKVTMIGAYQQAVEAASGDQKTSLTIALNNLVDGMSTLDNSIAVTTSNIEGTIESIQKAQAAAAASAFNQERRVVERNLDKAEDELERAFSDGDITKNEYVAKGIMLAQTKAEFFDEVSGAYNSFGKDESADKYLEKTEDMIRIHEGLVSVGQNIDDYEPLFTDSESPLTNLLGEKTQRGDVILTDVRKLKQSGRFEENYTLLDGVYHQVYYPSEFVDDDGFIRTDINIKELAKLRDDAFINVIGDDGVMGTERVRFVQFEDEDGQPISRPVSESRVQRLLETNQIIEDPKKGLIQAPPTKGGSGFLKVSAATQKYLEKNIPALKKTREVIETMRGNIEDQGGVAGFYKNFYGSKVPGAIRDYGNFVKDAYTKALPAIAERVEDFGEGVAERFQKGTNVLGNIFQKAKTGIGDFVTQARERVGDLFGKVEAAEPTPPTRPGRTVSFPKPSPPSQSSQPAQSQPGFVQSVVDRFKSPSFGFKVPEIPKFDFGAARRNLGKVGQDISSRFSNITRQITSDPDRFNLVKQARAVPGFLRTVVAPKIKSAVSSFFNRFRRK